MILVFNPQLCIMVGKDAAINKLRLFSFTTYACCVQIWPMLRARTSVSIKTKLKKSSVMVLPTQGQRSDVSKIIKSVGMQDVALFPCFSRVDR